MYVLKNKRNGVYGKVVKMKAVPSSAFYGVAEKKRRKSFYDALNALIKVSSIINIINKLVLPKIN